MRLAISCWNRMTSLRMEWIIFWFLAHDSVGVKDRPGNRLSGPNTRTVMQNTAVVHNASNQRFEIDIDGQLSILEHTFKNHRLFLTHTEVPPALEDQGLGTKLAHAALEYARQNELMVVAVCSFVKEYVG